MSRFAGRTVLVTGAGSGIGREMARQFLEEEATVYAADLNPAGVPEGSVPVTVDVTDPDSFAAAVSRTVSETGALHVLCNSAGASSSTDTLACSIEEWDRTFAVNSRGVFLGTKFALPHMLAQQDGAVINTASAAGLVGLKDRAAYCASKGAVIAFSRQVAVQYAGTGVRCNCICPGTVDSPWVGRLLAEADDPSQARAQLVARQPMGRLGTPAEVAAAALYLASDAAAFVTGTELVIDGGLLAG
ncbi:SDR family oxidoreductase [Streptomyces sp. NPDC047515]|uniref:SDR family NAD(P)-dependent oxidoreductase n=1 Tax=Streptomyces sp. NPDC047515 TaxID=3155380 RepID=UPI0033FA3214